MGVGLVQQWSGWGLKSAHSEPFMHLHSQLLQTLLNFAISSICNYMFVGPVSSWYYCSVRSPYRWDDDVVFKNCAKAEPRNKVPACAVHVLKFSAFTVWLKEVVVVVRTQSKQYQ